MALATWRWMEPRERRGAEGVRARVWTKRRVGVCPCVAHAESVGRRWRQFASARLAVSLPGPVRDIVPDIGASGGRSRNGSGDDFVLQRLCAIHNMRHADWQDAQEAAALVQGSGRAGVFDGAARLGERRMLAHGGAPDGRHRAWRSGGCDWPAARRQGLDFAHEHQHGGCRGHVFPHGCASARTAPQEHAGTSAGDGGPCQLRKPHPFRFRARHVEHVHEAVRRAHDARKPQCDDAFRGGDRAVWHSAVGEDHLYAELCRSHKNHGRRPAQVPSARRTSRRRGHARAGGGRQRHDEELCRPVYIHRCLSRKGVRCRLPRGGKGPERPRGIRDVLRLGESVADRLGAQHAGRGSRVRGERQARGRRLSRRMGARTRKGIAEFRHGPRESRRRRSL